MTRALGSLFARTIRENMRVGDPEATEAEIIAALGRAQATEITMRQPNGLDATIRNATRIFVFDHGRVVETGTFDELVVRGERFAELARAQFMVDDVGE